MEDATLLLWVERGKILAGFFVAIGVAGEFLGDFIANPIIKRRDAAQQAEIARLNKEAGDARRDSSEAIERAAKLEKETADAKRRQSEAEIQLAEIRKRQAPREIPFEKFVSTLKSARPGKAIIQFQQGNPEISLLAHMLQPALFAAGWDVTEPPTEIRSAAPTVVLVAMSEIFLYSSDLKGPSDKSSPVGGLSKALEESGFKPTIFLDTSIPKDTVRIVIGPKI